jgi:hypothetical protein
MVPFGGLVNQAVCCLMVGDWHCMEAECNRWKLYGAVWEPSAVLELYCPTWEPSANLRELYCAIWNLVGAVHWFYSGVLRTTLGSTVAKERRCGACRRLVCYVKPLHCVTVDSTQVARLYNHLTRTSQYCSTEQGPYRSNKRHSKMKTRPIEGQDGPSHSNQLTSPPSLPPPKRLFVYCSSCRADLVGTAGLS